MSIDAKIDSNVERLLFKLLDKAWEGQLNENDLNKLTDSQLIELNSMLEHAAE